MPDSLSHTNGGRRARVAGAVKLTAAAHSVFGLETRKDRFVGIPETLWCVCR